VSRKRSTKTIPAKPDLVSLLAELDHPDTARRRTAVEALGHLNDPQATLALLRALHDPDRCVRSWAAGMLGGVGSVPGKPQAVEPLITMLADTDADVRSSAAISLGYLRDPHAIQPLITCLHDPNASVRGHAANALGALGAREAVPLLLLTLQDADRMVRVWSAVALRNLAWVVDKPALAHIVPILLQTLQDRDPDVRQHAAHALARIGDRQAVDPLLTLLADPAGLVRYAVVEALGDLGDPRVLPALARIQANDHEMTVLGSVSEAATQAIDHLQRQNPELRH